MNKRILIIDDNEKICNLMKEFGAKKGYQADIALDIKSAINLINEHIYSLITLDIELEDENGLEKISELKEYFKGPILFVSCISETEKIIEGFTKGADDYITKPFDLNELYIRIERSIVRANTYNRIQIADYQIDKIREEVYLNDKLLGLSDVANKILIFLLENHNHVVTREQIFKEVWNADYTYSTRVIDTHVSHIRNATNDSRLRSIRSKGYTIEI